MQASRLLAILMLLQTRDRVTARDLADELEVSVRTIYRDILELGAAGVPVYAERGRGGGFRLLDGWRTTLTGLTGEEARSVAFVGLPGPADELGLGDSLASAQRKLFAALPDRWQEDALRISERFHLDLAPWYAQASGPGPLRDVAAAVWAARRIHVRYESWNGVSELVLDPLGLVLKAGTWYLVARSGRHYRTYRLSAMLELRLLDESFVRPRRFDLASHWRHTAMRFEASLYRDQAALRVTARGMRLLEHVSATVAAAARNSRRPADRRGWSEVEVPIESVGHAADLVLGFGDDAEVLAPRALRDAVAVRARRLASLYADGAGTGSPAPPGGSRTVSTTGGDNTGRGIRRRRP